MTAVFAVLTATVGVVTAPPAAAAEAEAEADEIAAADGIVSFLDGTLLGLTQIEQLAGAIPGTELSPIGNAALDLADVLSGISATVSGVPDKTAGNVESALEGVTSVGPVGVDIAVDIDLGAGTVTFGTFELSRTVDAPLAFADGEPGTADYFSLAGGELSGPVVLDLTSGGPLVLALAPDTATTPGAVTGLVGSVPEVVFSADLTLSGTFQARLGILDVSAAPGSPPDPAASASLEVTIGWLDPDSSGSITADELVNAAPTDLFDPSVTNGEVHLAVALTSGLAGLESVTGTVTLDDTDLTDGLDAPDFQLGDLGNFTNMTPQDVLAALAQLAISMRGLQLKLGNLDLPLLDENLAELGNWSDRISKLFTDHGLAVGENPVDLDIDASELQAEGLLTLEQIIAELEATLGLTAGALGLAYDPTDDVATFTIGVTDDSFFHETPEASINVADELAEAGITGLTLDGGASITIAPTYSLDLTVGLDLSDALATSTTPITDRIFLEIGSGDEFSLDVPIEAELALKGTIGFLQIDLDAVDPPVDLLARADSNEPMLTVDLATSGDNRLTLTKLFDATGTIAVETQEDDPALAPGQFRLDLGVGTTIVATANVGVPGFELNASTSLGGVPAASAGVGFAWPNLFAGDPQITTSGDFNDNFLAFNVDNEDPLALFATILQGVESVFGTLQALDQQANDAGDLLNEELPLVSTSMEDALEFIRDVREALNALSSDPAASVQQLELQANAVIAAALDGLDGSVDLSVPALPDPAEFTAVVDGDEVFDQQGYSDAVNAYLTDLQTFVTESADFLEIRYETGNSPGSLILDFDIGVCSDKTQHAGCVFEYPITKPFNLDLGDHGGGLIGADSAGELGVDYGVVLSADFGIDLPEVTPTPGGLPSISGTPELFVLDSSGITGEIAGFAEGEIGATVGPFEVQVGDDTGIPETACDDAVDDDEDGKVNDGCPPVDEPETGTQCDDALDGEEDFVQDSDPETEGDQTIPADGKVNDGCPAVGNPLEARAGVSLSITNDIGDPGPGDRSTDFETFFSGLEASATPASGVDCGDGAVLACADLPVYVAVGDTTEFLGTIEFSQDDFDTAPTLTGADTVFANLQAAAEGFLWALVGDGIVEFGNYVERTLDAGEYGAEIPVVGDLLDAGAEVGAAFNDNIAGPVGTLVGSLDSAGDFAAVESAVRDFFWDQLGPEGANLLLNHDDVVSDGDPSQATTPIKTDDIVVVLRCGSDSHVCDPDAEPDPDSFLDLSDLQVEFKMGQVAGGATPQFDFGVPGLRLSGGEGTVSSTVSWQLNVGFGIGLSDGFYLLTDTSVDDTDPTDGSGAGEELTLSAAVDVGVPAATGDQLEVPDESLAALQGDLAFIGVDVFNAKADREDAGAGGDTDGRDAHEIAIQLSVDIPDPSGTDKRLGMSELVTGLDPTDFGVNLDAGVDLWVTIATSVDLGSGDPAAIPRLLADLSLEWEITGDLTDGVEYGDLDASFGNVRLDLGSFIAEFLAPVLSEIQRVSKPLQPVIDTLQAPIPGVSQLAELVGADPVTLLDLMEALADADLTLIRRLLDVISFANAIPTNVEAGDPSLIIPLGSFGLKSEALGEPELPANKKGDLISGETLDGGVSGGVFGASQFDGLGSSFGNEFDQATGSDGGFSFPAFENPSQLFGLIVGENPTLVRFDAGTLRAEVSQSFTFGPITIGPVPVSVVVSVGAAVEGRFAMGYDTKGIRQMVQNLTDEDTGNDGFFENLGVLFAGVFIDDLDAQGNDVPEIRLILEAAVGAAVDLVIVKAGVEAGVRATLDLNLHDGGFTNPIPPENLDGKLRIDEIIQVIQANPICLFDVSGKLEAFIRLFVTIDLFLFSATFKQTIVNIVLLELDNITAELCEPPPPVLAAKSGTGGATLLLNMGERAEHRNYDEGNPDEKFTVRQLSEGTSGVKVSVTAFGIVQEYEGIDRVVGSGSAGDDTIVTEQGAISGVCQNDGTTVEPDIGYGCEGDPEDPSDDAEPGGTVTKLIPFSIPVDFCGGADSDTLGGGAGDDHLRGDGALSGTACATNDSGSDGPDKITGGAGVDHIWGDGEADDLNGDAGDDVIRGGAGGDEIAGGAGKDDLRGEADGDIILGGPEADPCPDDDRDQCSDAADDTIRGGGGIDNIEGDHGGDRIYGGAEGDIVVGGFGDDEIDGQSGDDQLFGNQGWDILRGQAGDDDIIGGVGNDALYGGADEDDIVGEAGQDTIDGGAGYDAILGDLGSINRGPDPDPSGDGFTPADPDLPLVDLVDADLSAPGVTAADFVDTVAGGDDPDRIWGQEGGDVINGNGGVDIVRGNDGDDTISGDQDGDELYGDEGADTIHGDDPTASHGAADGVDTIRGGPGDDLIEGNAAGDKLFGDGDRDTIFGDAQDEEPTCTLDGADTIRGGPAGDYLFGNADGDDIFGNGGVDRIVGGSDSFGVCDADDTIEGGTGADVIAGDNATIADATDPEATEAGVVLVPDEMLVSTWLDDQGAGDTVHGDGGDAPGADDRIFGQYGDDQLHGDAGADYVEGNDGVDTIAGGPGQDDLIGGSSASDDEGGGDDPIAIVDDDRSGQGRQDAGDIIDGDEGEDWITGDNAIVTRNVPATDRAPIELFDVGRMFKGAPEEPATGTSGVDTIDGGDEPDRIFGQGQGDVITGGDGADYVEGNDGDDTIDGEGDDDDLIGGGSAYDGVIDDDRVGTGLLDSGETRISGGPGQDWITGDNAIIVRSIPAPERAADRVPIELFDVELFEGDEVPPQTSGGDFLTGDAGEDRIFGQGNGDQLYTQTDPLDGRNNDFIGSDLGDDDFERATGTTDEDGDDPGEWLGDVIWGGTGDDEIEGNHGNDLIYGNAPAGHPDTVTPGPNEDEDDIVGGGSADDGVIDDDRLEVGANLLDGHDVIHGDEGLANAGDDDVVLGDNGWIVRTGDVQTGDGPEVHTSGPNAGEAIPVSIPVRTTETGFDPPGGTFGNDHLLGNGGHDDLIGQAGDDALDGEWGSDGIIGDLGIITVDLLGAGDDPECSTPTTIEPREPFISEDACQTGTLFRRVQLFRFDDSQSNVVEGDDVILGGDGDDWIHGGPGVDLVNGDGDADGSTELEDPETGIQTVADPNAGSVDADRIFGGDSNGAGTVDPDSLGDGDALWGGRGHDHLYGGHGADNHDIRADPDDPAEPFPETWWAWAFADQESYHGVDYIYGGHGPDAMQANVADNGPVTGDRLMDWAGVFNLSLLCPATYGAYVTIRDMSPNLIDFWEEMADADGVHMVEDDSPSSGYRELAMVYKPDVKDNNNPPYPGTPGHFFACGD